MNEKAWKRFELETEARNLYDLVDDAMTIVRDEVKRGRTPISLELRHRIREYERLYPQGFKLWVDETFRGN